MSEAYKAAVIATHLSDLCNESAWQCRAAILDGFVKESIASAIAFEDDARRLLDQIYKVKELLKQGAALAEAK